MQIDSAVLLTAAAAPTWVSLIAARNWVARRLARSDALVSCLDAHNQALEAFIAHPSADAEAFEMVADLSDWAASRRSASLFLETMIRVANEVRATAPSSYAPDQPPRELVVMWSNVMETAIDLASVLATGDYRRASEVRRLMAGYEDLERPAITLVVRERAGSRLGHLQAA